MGDIIVAILGILLYFATGLSYMMLGGRHAIAVADRVRADNKSLGILAFLCLVFAWPVTVTLWTAFSLLLRRRWPRPFTPVVEQARLAAEKAEIEMRRDWETRAAFWYVEAQRAEAENDQALKWFVAEQLSFLLDTCPDGAQPPEKAHAATVAKGENWVGYCNVCARYHKREQLKMEGICDECSEQQGLC